MPVILLVYIFSVDQPLVINEVMSNVKGSDSGSGSPGDRNEYIELYNQSPDTIDLSLFSLSDFDAQDSICAWQDERLLNKYPKVRINSTRLYPYSFCLILDCEYVSDTTTGGYVQPYDFPDSLLIVTTANTTIGNGLQTSDPIIIFSSAMACTSSFGTPDDSLDNFPDDPGDGIAWERIDISLPDAVDNWYPSLDSTGGTPGRVNSTSTDFDLGLDSSGVICVPAEIVVGENLVINVWVKNFGLKTASNYYLMIFDDFNNNYDVDSGELLAKFNGGSIPGFDSLLFSYLYEQPAQGIHSLGFQIEFNQDKNLSNNLLFKKLAVSGQFSELSINPQIFTPNGDGNNDRLQIDYRLPESGGHLTLSLFDMRGKHLFNIFKDQYCAEDIGTVYWDGKNGNRSFGPGMYIVYLEYRYKAQITKAKKTAVLAR